MTACGIRWLIFIMAAFVVAIPICMVGQGTPQSRRKAPRQLPLQGSRGEAQVFRHGEEKIVICEAWDKAHEPAELSRLEAAEASTIQRYQRTELAYVLADQLLHAGGIRFTEEGGKIRATLRAVVETPSAADSLSRCATAPSEREPRRERTLRAVVEG